jgi:putative transposase
MQTSPTRRADQSIFDSSAQTEFSAESDTLGRQGPKRQTSHPTRWIGIDLNTKGHIAVVANPETGKVLKLGSDVGYTHMKYLAMRKTAKNQRENRGASKRLKQRHHAIIQDRLQKISRDIVQEAQDNGCGIRMENLNLGTGVNERIVGYTMASWTFKDLVSLIEKKAKKHGIPVEYVDPSHTSKMCSRCGNLGIRSGKKFRCPHCGHTDHADANAAFNIALRNTTVAPDQSGIDRVVPEGSTDAPQQDVLPWRLGEFDVEGFARFDDREPRR